jgi:hypothetical protein
LRLLKLAKSSELSRRGGLRKGGGTSWEELTGEAERALELGSEAAWRAAKVHLMSLVAPAWSGAAPSTVTEMVATEDGSLSVGREMAVTVPGIQPAAESGSHTRVPLA